jgi:hypothetical protein
MFRHRAVSVYIGPRYYLADEVECGQICALRARSARAQTEFHNCFRERRNSSALPNLGSKSAQAAHDHHAIRSSATLAFTSLKTSALKAAVKSIVCRRVSVRNMTAAHYFFRNIGRRGDSATRTSSLLCKLRDLYTTANDGVVRRALESAGIEFIDENGGGLGCACASGSD